MQIPETQQAALRRAPPGPANESPAQTAPRLRAVPGSRQKRAVSSPPTPKEIAAAEKLFLEHLSLIERIITDSARRSSFLPQDGEDFASWVKLRLIENDYRILRAYKGLSSLPTFVTTVIKNLGRDYQDHLWGKYRPSAPAKELGANAIALEKLLVRDGYDLDEAIRIQSTNLGSAASEVELRELATRLKPRQRRRFVDAEVLEQQAVHDDLESRADSDLNRRTEARLQEILEVSLGKLSAQDFLILQLYYGEGKPISQIAKALGLEQRPLYRRCKACLDTLQEALIQAGIGWPEVRALLSWEDRNLKLSFLDKLSKGPSKDIVKGLSRKAKHER